LHPDATAKQRIEDIKSNLLEMNPAQRNTHLDVMTQFLEGSATTVDIKLPKKAPQGRGRPKGATKNPKTTTTKPKPTAGATQKAKSTTSTTNKPKSTTRDPSQFEYLEKTRKKKKKKKEQEEALEKQNKYAPATQTRPI
jgi:hypothetical protein